MRKKSDEAALPLEDFTGDDPATNNNSCSSHEHGNTLAGDIACCMSSANAGSIVDCVACLHESRSSWMESVEVGVRENAHMLLEYIKSASSKGVVVNQVLVRHLVHT